MPHLNSEMKALVFLLSHIQKSEIDWLVGEVLGDLSSWSFDSDLSGLDFDFDYMFTLYIKN